LSLKDCLLLVLMFSFSFSLLSYEITLIPNNKNVNGQKCRMFPGS
jgi:hypothetical protein